LFGEGRHPEAYIPYDPAYRARAQGLVRQVAGDLGVGGTVVNNFNLYGVLDKLGAAREIDALMTKYHRTNGRMDTNIQVRR
jgi:hypothetical protein